MSVAGSVTAGASREAAERYELIELIGLGSSSEVWRAVDTATNDEVAVKVVDLEDIDDDLGEIQQEISLLQQCRSPNIVQYHGAFLVPGTARLHIAMELMATSAADLISPEAKGSPLPEQHTAYILREVLNALVYLHSEHQIHRDIKAANILLSHAGDVKVADFGVAAQLGHAVGLKRRTFIGSPLWMAPEVIQQSPDLAGGGGEEGNGDGSENSSFHDGYDEAADIWSLGITAMELALGQPPRAGMPAFRLLFVIVKEAPPQLDESFSAAFRGFAGQCLQRDPEQRPSAIDLLMHPFVVQAERPDDFVARVAKAVANKPPPPQHYSSPSDGGPANFGTVISRQPGNSSATATAAATAAAVGTNQVTSTSDDADWDFGTVRTKQQPPPSISTGTQGQPEKTTAATITTTKPPPLDIPSSDAAMHSQAPPTYASATDSSRAIPSAVGATALLNNNSNPVKSVVQPALASAAGNNNPRASAAATSAVAAFEALEIASPGATVVALREMVTLLSESGGGSESLAQLKTALDTSLATTPAAAGGGRGSGKSAAPSAGVDLSTGKSRAGNKTDLGPLGNFLVRRWQATGGGGSGTGIV